MPKPSLKGPVAYVRLAVEQLELLKELSIELDIPVSTLIRHAIANYLIDQGKI